MMKGVSPVTRKQQAEAAIQEYLGRHLADAAGALRAFSPASEESKHLLNNWIFRSSYGRSVRCVLGSGTS